ncbi:hypothetical protein [Halopiger goleimassiliensis]|uniref:hypothetical protein n=1 Tax=Halopiger goleimassiliensis TaxID=1293048 RepID=UPI00067824A2|nr:hypothetical protein [Halopiger goleimassiliensis]
MGDEQSHRPSSAEDADSTDDEPGTDSLEPGGGPRRVVSDQSVDDILNSLEETPGSTPDDGGQTMTYEESAVRTVERTDDAEPAASEQRDADGASDGADSSAEAQSTSAADSLVEEAERESTAEATTDGEDDPSQSADGDGDATQPSPDEIADRLESAQRTEITGADVRAAETDPDRESTPDVGEIDLTMDDLEETVGDSADGTVTSDDSSGTEDAGPLAGSIDSDAQAEPDDDEASEPGVLGRVKRFFFG